MVSDLVSYTPPTGVEIAAGQTNLGDDEPYTPQAVTLWSAMGEHFSQVGMPLSDAQWVLLWSGVAAWDRGIKGDKSAATEANRLFKAFNVTPDSLLARQISIREDTRAEERAGILKARAAKMAEITQPSALTVVIEEGRV